MFLKLNQIQDQCLTSWLYLCSAECIVFGTNRTKFERWKTFKYLFPPLQVTSQNTENCSQSLHTFFPTCRECMERTHYTEIYFSELIFQKYPYVLEVFFFFFVIIWYSFHDKLFSCCSQAQENLLTLLSQPSLRCRRLLAGLASRSWRDAPKNQYG